MALDEVEEVLVGGKMPSFLSSDGRKSMGGRLEGLPSAILDGALGEFV